MCPWGWEFIRPNPASTYPHQRMAFYYMGTFPVMRLFGFLNPTTQHFDRIVAIGNTVTQNSKPSVRIASFETPLL